ncbi:hypothetical protein KW787_02690 [Candidatus Pacearchaeota archaeon]|nr:hypothetical protein [Candidatus Pacearchaeota archaeon]
METLLVERTGEIRRTKEELEEKLKVKITIVGRKVTIEGDPLEEYEASAVLDAISFGFSAKKALMLKSEDMIFRKIPIRNFTRRKDLRDVKSRLIGTEGKTKKTVETIAECDIVIQKNSVGVIGSTESVDAAETAITNIIKGSKQANAYRYLERMNQSRKVHPEGLGLKEKKRNENT